MSDIEDAFEEARRSNVRRYQRLLQTRLTDIERLYVQARLSEQQSAICSTRQSASWQPGKLTAV
jgi:hypothetical protein